MSAAAGLPHQFTPPYEHKQEHSRATRRALPGNKWTVAVLLDLLISILLYTTTRIKAISSCWTSLSAQPSSASPHIYTRIQTSILNRVLRAYRLCEGAKEGTVRAFPQRGNLTRCLKGYLFSNLRPFLCDQPQGYTLA